jgi:hypothetical protein
MSLVVTFDQQAVQPNRLEPITPLRDLGRIDGVQARTVQHVPDRDHKAFATHFQCHVVIFIDAEKPGPDGPLMDRGSPSWTGRTIVAF